jgi:hypothetical protein
MAKIRLWTALELEVEVNTLPALNLRNYTVNYGWYEEVKFTLEQDTKVQREGRGIALLFL